MKSRVLTRLGICLLAVMMIASMLPIAAFASSAVSNNELSVTDFSFYEVWSKNNSSDRSETPTALAQKNGKYILYVPYSAFATTTSLWNVRVEAPERYTGTFTLYYTTFRDSTGNSNYSNVGCSVNAESEEYTNDSGVNRQSITTDACAKSFGTSLSWSNTMTLTWTVGGQKRSCKISLVPYCDMGKVVNNFYAHYNNDDGSYGGNYIITKEENGSYKTQVIQNRKTSVIFSLFDALNRLNVKLNDTKLNDKNNTFSAEIDTTEVGTKEYTFTLSDADSDAESRSYKLIVETVAIDYTPAVDYSKSMPNQQTSPANLYAITSTDNATLKLALTNEQQQQVKEANGTTTYQWTLADNVVSTTDSYTFDTTYNVSKATVTCLITNIINGAKWEKVYTINVSCNTATGSNAAFNVSIENKGQSTYALNQQSGELVATVTDDGAPQESGLAYQWFKGTKKKNGWSWSLIFLQTGKTYCPPTNKSGETGYYCYIRPAYAPTVKKVTDAIVGNSYVTITVNKVTWSSESGITGSGTKTDPYQLTCQESLVALRDMVNSGVTFEGKYFKMTDDIALPANWEPIGCLKDKNVPLNLNDVAAKGTNMNPFSGTIDGGDHTLTVPKGGKPLLNFAREATVKNLKIQGERIEGNGLLQYYTVDYGEDGNYSTGVPDTITIENCHIIGNTSITQSGFLGGYASGANKVTISNCTVGENVVVGCDKDKNRIGSIAGAFNGTITNCTSAATVYGTSAVGGLVGYKGQSMGLCTITNCSFTGKVIATGSYVGGILGSGYSAESAPNSPWATIKNCYVSGTVQGNDYVGGITGGEPGTIQCWSNGSGGITDNAFYGTISATGNHVGGIAGNIRSLNKYTTISNNYYLYGCGADKGIGLVQSVDTKAAATAVEGTTYVCTANGYTEEYFKKGDFSRTDDPLGADADKLTAKKTTTEFTNETVVGLLNASETSWKNWTQGENGPVFGNEAVVISLTASGKYKTSYTLGVDTTLNLDGLTFTAKWSDGKTTDVSPDDENLTHTDFNPNAVGEQEITFCYGAATASIKVNVVKNYTDEEKETFGETTVLFTLTNDSAFVHDTNGNPITGVSIKVKYFDLTPYGLAGFNLTDNDGNIVEKPTVLHLFITALERYKLGLSEEECGTGKLAEEDEDSDLLNVTGSAGSLFMAQFWNHDQNLLYYVNGDYPLQKGSANKGATADQIVLKDGDFIDVAMFTDWSFYTNENGGFRYFIDSSDSTTAPKKEFELVEGEDLMLTCVTAHADMNGSKATYTPVGENVTVYYSKAMGEVSGEQKLLTDGNGKIILDTDGLTAGTYYIWTDAGLDNYGNIVCAPASATVVVKTSAQNVEDLIEALGEVDEITLDSKDAIEAAREAYENLSTDEKALFESDESKAALLAKLKAAEEKYADLRQQQEEKEHSRSHGGTTNYYVVHTYINGEGAIDPCGTTGNVMVKSGKSKTFTFTPAAGYEVADVLVNNESVGAVTSYTFTNVDHDKNLEITFVKSANAAATSSVITDTPAVKNPNTGAEI